MKAMRHVARVRAQAMIETLVVAAVLVVAMTTFAFLVSAFLDHGYRSLRLFSMGIP